MFLPEHLTKNLIQVASQTPPRVLQDNNLILLMGLMCIHLWDLLLTILKGKMFILLMGKQITRPIMLITHRVTHVSQTPIEPYVSLVSIKIM
jgi:hypothetical protein